MKPTVRGVRSVDIDMSQPERAAAFYKSVWHLTEVERRDGSIYFRGTGPSHHILAIHPAPNGFAIRRMTFDAASKDIVHALHKAVTAAGCQSDAPHALAGPGGGYGFGFADPEGRNLAVVCDAADHKDAADTPDRPRKIAHVNLNAARLRQERQIPDRRAGLPQGRPQRPAALLSLRQSRPLLDRDGPDRDADRQPRLVRDAGRGIGDARRGPHARRRLSAGMGRRPPRRRQQRVRLFRRAGGIPDRVHRRGDADRRQLTNSTARNIGSGRPAGSTSGASRRRTRCAGSASRTCICSRRGSGGFDTRKRGATCLLPLQEIVGCRMPKDGGIDLIPQSVFCLLT